MNYLRQAKKYISDGEKLAREDDYYRKRLERKKKNYKKGRAYYAAFWLSLLAVFICFATFVLGLVFLGVGSYRITRDITGWIERAADAPSAESMLEYLLNAKAEFENEKATDGYTALVFQKQTNDLTYHYQDLLAMLDELQDDMFKASNEPELAEIAQRLMIQDYRTAIHRLNGKTHNGLHWIRYGWIALITILSSLIMFIVFVGLAVHYSDEAEHKLSECRW